MVDFVSVLLLSRTSSWSDPGSPLLIRPKKVGLQGRGNKKNIKETVLRLSLTLSLCTHMRKNCQAGNDQITREEPDQTTRKFGGGTSVVAWCVCGEKELTLDSPDPFQRCGIGGFLQ